MRWCARRGSASLAITLAAATVEACSLGSFACEDQADCLDGALQGTCEPGGGCSFPDDGCDSGKRFGEHAPGGQGGQCVPVDTGTSDGETGTATVSTTTPGETTFSTSDDGSTDESTTMGASATATTGSDTSVDSSSSSDGASDSSTGDVPGFFFDPFDRPDAMALGNGWIEKDGAAFRIVSEQVEVESGFSIDLRDALFYRPASESMLNVEASVVVDFTTDNPLGYPQLHLRAQTGDIQMATYLNSYAIVVDSDEVFNPVLTVQRISGYGLGIEDWNPIDPDPLGFETYRLRGRVTGTDPVVVEGFLEVWNGVTWDVRTTATLVDGDFDRLVSPGTVGASGHLDLGWFVLDDFSYEDLGG